MTTHLIVGPSAHGVTRLALELHATPALRDDPVVRVTDGVGTDLIDAVRRGAMTAAAGGPVHAHVTDRLFGTDAPAAADALTALADEVALTVTLHDLPQPSDGADAHPRRAAAYARIARTSRGVIVSSEHESALLTDVFTLVGVEPVSVSVVPLPVDPPATLPPVDPLRARPRRLGVLGYLYPGKGHAEAIAACASLPPDVEVVAIGRPSDGHEDLVATLRDTAAVQQRRFEVTGYLPDDQLAAALSEVAVPVAPHQHLSASGSINSWLTAGRRPLVPRSRYALELERRCPGALFVYDDLESACREALGRPELTVLGAGVELTPTRDQAGAAYAELLARWAA